MPLSPGIRLGPYEVIGTLGAGGMGEVYRARDTTLNRDVALKVLPDLFAEDPDRLARFTREAQVLASLNHPNIAAIYGIEQKALVMELVPGDDLSALIARGPIPAAEALPIARQIADALEAAHDSGVVHRDLKPGNIKVKPDGAVKVLDFGLAKALAPEGASAASGQNDSPTLTARATQLGTILGTAAYMAPEQARGKAVDRRADIWAFGAVLYEMLTGRRAFNGDDVSITLASVLKDEPNWHALPAGLSPSLARLLRRCLEKDPRKRLSAIGDARLELDEQESGGAGPAAPPAKPARAVVLGRLWPFVAGIGLAAVVAAVLWPRGGTAANAAVVRLSFLAPPGERLYPDSMGVALSPDGKMVAYIVGSSARTDNQLWVRSLDSMKARLIEAGAGGNLPFWSPDSKRIGFFTSTKLKIVSVEGGRADTIADTPSGRGATWSAGNVLVFAPAAGGPLYRIPATGGQMEPVTTLDPARQEYGHRMPVFLPDGEHFLYAALPARNGKFDVFAGSIKDHSRVQIGAFDAAPVFAEPGWLLYARQGVLAAVPFDPHQLKVTGDVVLLEDEPASILDPLTSWTAGHSVWASPSGALAYYAAPSLNTVATWYDASGVATGTINMPPGHYEAVSVSPDGTRAVMVKSSSPSESSLWLVDLLHGGASPLSTGRGRNDTPVWAPDGSRVVWANDRNGPEDLFVKNINDAQPERMLFSSPAIFKNPDYWSGDWILMTQLDQDSAQNIYALDASGTKPPVPVVHGPVRDMSAQVSPDGHWLAFTSEDSGQSELYVQSFPTPGHRRQVSQSGGVECWWTPGGGQLVFLGVDIRTMWRVDVKERADSFEFGTPQKFATLPADTVAVSAMPDRRRFIGIAPERIGTGSITVVQNWKAAIK